MSCFSPGHVSILFYTNISFPMIVFNEDHAHWLTFILSHMLTLEQDDDNISMFN